MRVAKDLYKLAHLLLVRHGVLPDDFMRQRLDVFVRVLRQPQQRVHAIDEVE